MKYLKQFLIIAAVSFAGELLKWLIPLPISASVYGVVLMFLCLALHIIKVEDVRETALFFIEIMPVMFIPAAVGLMEPYPFLMGFISGNYSRFYCHCYGRFGYGYANSKKI